MSHSWQTYSCCVKCPAAFSRKSHSNECTLKVVVAAVNWFTCHLPCFLSHPSPVKHTITKYTCTAPQYDDVGASHRHYTVTKSVLLVILNAQRKIRRKYLERSVTCELQVSRQPITGTRCSSGERRVTHLQSRSLHSCWTMVKLP